MPTENLLDFLVVIDVFIGKTHQLAFLTKYFFEYNFGRGLMMIDCLF